MSTRQSALEMAVLHHGMANLCPDAIPARVDTIIATAVVFDKWLNGQSPMTIETKRPTHYKAMDGS